MGVISQADKLKAYKAAQTPKEMVESWAPPVEGAKTDELHRIFKVYEEKAPHLDIIKTYIHQPEIKMMERGILNPKAKELAKLALALDMVNTASVTAQVVAAKARGATDEEIMDTVWLASYSARKNAVANLGIALTEGWKLAEALKTREQMEETRKAGKKYLIDPVEESEAYKAAKTPAEMVASWASPMKMDKEQLLKQWDEEEGPLAAVFKIWGDKGPNLNMVKDLWHDTIIQWTERLLDGQGADLDGQSYVWWVTMAKQENLGAVTFHVPHLLARGLQEEEIIELFYLLSTEVSKAFLARVGPALEEGFRQAAELGL